MFNKYTLFFKNSNQNDIKKEKKGEKIKRYEGKYSQPGESYLDEQRIEKEKDKSLK